MHPIEAFVRNPVKIAVGVLFVALFGVIALLRMPMQLTPEVQIPTITISTRWRGASPGEIEREIVQEQEEQLDSVEGVTKMSSESLDSQGRITLEFAVGADMQEALVKVNSRLQQVREYPEDADEPVISASSASNRAIAWFILSARMPTRAQIEQFQREHPKKAELLEPVRRAHSPGLAVLRLRRLAEQHPDLAPLLPPDVDIPKYRRFAEDFIEPEFERVDGVSNSNVVGGQEPEMQVVVDPHRLAHHGLTIADVRRVLRGENQDTSAGDFWEGKRRWVVRTRGQFTSIEHVENQILAIDAGNPVYVRDVAEVERGFKKPDVQVRRFGKSSIAINAQRVTGANVLDVMKGLRKKNRQLNEGILADRGLQLTQVYDETDYIYSAVDLVRQNIYIGGALTMVVLMLFLHLGRWTLFAAPLIGGTALAAAFVSPWVFLVTLTLIVAIGFRFARGALVVGLAIPTSIIGTFLVLRMLDRSLNVVSLAGLAFAVGMLVDNAVVVLENIYRHFESGERPFVAAVSGTKEVWGAVVASTLTTLAVFLPVLFVEEEAGQLFRDIALGISSAVALSLVVSVTVIPTAAARLFHRAETDDNADTGDDDFGTARRGAAAGQRFAAFIVGWNAWAQQGVRRRVTVIAGLVGAAVLVSWLLWPKVEYLPSGNRNLVIGLLFPPPGYNLDRQMEMGAVIEHELRDYWDVDLDSPEAAQLDYPVISDWFYVASGRRIFLGVRSAEPTRAGELAKLLLTKLKPKLPGTIVVAKQTSLFERGLDAGRTIDIEITGPELTRLVAIGGQILQQAGDVAGVIAPDGKTVEQAQAQPVPSLDLSSPEVTVRPKRIQAADMEINAQDLGYTVDALIDGAYACDYFEGSDKIDLTIVGSRQYALRTQDVAALPVATPIGRVVPLGSIGVVQIASGPEQINRRERQRAITIRVTPPLTVPLEDALDRINTQIVEPMRHSGQLDGGYVIGLSGTADKLRNTWLALRWNVVLALLITYLLMAALFESWLYPLVIIFSVPLAAVGGIAGLRLLGLYVQLRGMPPQALDVLTMLGFVILIGTAVNNAILIVHQALNHMRHDRLDPHDAVLESVRTRIRPIFMTTTTTVFGLAPLVFFPGAGSELYRGLGSVVLGGLLVSTVFTLILVPTLFTLAMDFRNWLRPLGQKATR